MKQKKDYSKLWNNLYKSLDEFMKYTIGQCGVYSMPDQMYKKLHDIIITYVADYYWHKGKEICKQK